MRAVDFQITKFCVFFLFSFHFGSSIYFIWTDVPLIYSPMIYFPGLFPWFKPLIYSHDSWFNPLIFSPDLFRDLFPLFIPPLFNPLIYSPGRGWRSTVELALFYVSPLRCFPGRRKSETSLLGDDQTTLPGFPKSFFFRLYRQICKKLSTGNSIVAINFYTVDLAFIFFFTIVHFSS